MKYYNRTNTCNRCGISFEKSPGHPMREYNKNHEWTGNWDCMNCYQKYDPNSKDNTFKRITNRRTGNLNPYSNIALGDRAQKLTCYLFGVEDLNLKYDNYMVPIDHTKHPNLGIIETKARIYNDTQSQWKFDFRRYQHKNIDHIICYCISGNRKIIERIYIFPWGEIMMRKYIGITKYDSKGRLYNGGWYEEYVSKDEELLKRANEIWNDIINGR